MTARLVRKAMLEGMQVANKRYEKWSGGWWLTDSGVEGHAVATIVGKLHQCLGEKTNIVMELPFDTIKDWSEAGRPQGRPRKTLNSRNRVDIAILNKADYPIWVIEIKRFWNKEQCFRDLERIRDLVVKYGDRRDGSLAGGFLGCMLAKGEVGDSAAQQRLEEQAKQIMSSIANEFDAEGLALKCHLGEMREYPAKYRHLSEGVRWAHAGFCVALRSR